jgi:hypothetical protein
MHRPTAGDAPLRKHDFQKIAWIERYRFFSVLGANPDYLRHGFLGMSVALTPKEGFRCQRISFFLKRISNP